MVKRQNQPADDAHEHHGETDGVENIHAQQVAERLPTPGDEIFLQAKEQAKGKNLRAPADGGVSDLRGRQILLPQFFGTLRERNDIKKQKQSGGEGSSPG